MSQLSFADVFNLARETADNSPVIQAGQQIAETVPTVHRMMSEQYSRGRFIRVFKDTGRHLGRWEVFSDFRHCCKVSDEAAFCLIQRPYISKTLLTRRISPRGSP